MGSRDIERQAPNVFRMKLLGANIISVESGSKTLKDAMNEALRDWVSNVEDTFYIIGTAAGPHPYPMLVRDFQAIIGEETKKQIIEQEGRLPDSLVACIGGGSNALGLFYPFLDDLSVKLYGIEAAGKGINTSEHAASLTKGSPGILHGNRTYLLHNSDGQIKEAHSISAGLDYPGVGPEHSYLKDVKRVEYIAIGDDKALDAFQFSAKYEGILPALELSHALGFIMDHAPNLDSKHIIVMNMWKRG